VGNQNKSQKKGKFSALKNHHPKRHDLPPIRHNFTTKNHHVLPQICRTPFKNISEIALFPPPPPVEKNPANLKFLS
jgi:hypothetical protein